MPRSHRHVALPEKPPRPASAVHGADYERQAAAMAALRELTNQIGKAFRARDERLLALAISHSLSRRDMAIATGLNKSRVDQIIREMADEQDRLRARALRERVRRHLPTD
jgi:hypothetical protein